MYLNHQFDITGMICVFFITLLPLDVKVVLAVVDEEVLVLLVEVVVLIVVDVAVVAVGVVDSGGFDFVSVVVTVFGICDVVVSVGCAVGTKHST